ncbi:MAG: creatininase family protein [Anaerorhabdus sp.]|uniref:creatininase family protein n=1 Tax=Anaerorhabdus sp. TaxID=1872524 RepID=UPI003A837E5F
MHARDLTSKELEEKIRDNYIAILPIGSCEQHGPHLPITTDIDLAEFMATEIARKNKAVIFPSLNFGYSWVWTGLSGTITLSQETFKKVVYELTESIVKMGFDKILLVNGHDSNKMALKYVIRDLSEHYDAKFLNIFYPNMNEIYAKYMESEKWYGMFHAEEFETSLMMAYDESRVRKDNLVSEYPDKPKYYGIDESSLWDVSQSGVFGDATKASKEKGYLMMNDFIEEISQLLKD